MSFFAPQNPGIGGLEELTQAEELFLTRFAGLGYNEGDILAIVSGQPEWVTGGGVVDIETFEETNKNLASYPYTLNYTGDDLTSITYDLGGGQTITKTLNRTGDKVTSIVLSGDLPSGITATTKTLTYTLDTLTSITYL